MIQGVRVLVVEDEPAVRGMVDIVLTRHGHNVLAAATADLARALLYDFPTPPDVALLDVVLPGMSGLVFADELSRQFPAIRLVFMTGWTDRVAQAEAMRRGTLIAKPFGPGDLLQALSA